jgi:hypothetical protein
MTVERLHELFEQHPDRSQLTWTGTCQDCGHTATVNVHAKADGIHISGGSVYEPEPDRFLLKCENCFQIEPVLQNYQPCEVYSRIVGYLRPVHQWNDAKAAEFRQRRLFDAALR